MARLTLTVSDTVHTAIMKMPKLNRGRFVERAVSYYLTTAEGKSIYAFAITDNTACLADETAEGRGAHDNHKAGLPDITDW